jgi:flavin-dependent thymidylate synthase
VPEPSKALTNYVDKAMFDAQPISEVAMERPIVYLLSATPDPLGALAAACMIYEGKAVHHLDEVSNDQRRFYFEDIWNTTLQAPLEDIDFHFVVEGLTRASWDQMVRQRTANFGGESLRFSVKLPLTKVVRPGPTVNTEKRLGIHKRTVDAIESGYAELIDDGVPAEDARGLIPLNVLVQGHWKTNLRNLATEIGKRTCTQAQWEWRMILLSRGDPQLPRLHPWQRARIVDLDRLAVRADRQLRTALAPGLLHDRQVHVQGEGRPWLHDP